MNKQELVKFNEELNNILNTNESKPQPCCISLRCKGGPDSSLVWKSYNDFKFCRYNDKIKIDVFNNYMDKSDYAFVDFDKIDNYLDNLYSYSDVAVEFVKRGLEQCYKGREDKIKNTLRKVINYEFD